MKILKYTEQDISMSHINSNQKWQEQQIETKTADDSGTYPSAIFVFNPKPTRIEYSSNWSDVEAATPLNSDGASTINKGLSPKCPYPKHLYPWLLYPKLQYPRHLSLSYLYQVVPSPLPFPFCPNVHFTKPYATFNIPNVNPYTSVMHNPMYWYSAGYQLCHNVPVCPLLHILAVPTWWRWWWQSPDNVSYYWPNCDFHVASK